MCPLADIVIPGHHFGQVTESVPGADAFVLMTLGLLAFLFGGFTVAAFILWRRERHPTPDKRLLMELEEEEEREHSRPPSQPARAGPEEEAGGTAQPWERPADWWRK